MACGVVLAAVVAGCFATADLSKDKAAMVAVAKAAGVIDRRLPPNCTRIYRRGDWGTIDDDPAWHRDDKRCTSFSRKAMLVFRRASERWILVTVKRSGYGRFGSCAVDGGPR